MHVRKKENVSPQKAEMQDGSLHCILIALVSGFPPKTLSNHFRVLPFHLEAADHSTTAASFSGSDTPRCKGGHRAWWLSHGGLHQPLGQNTTS